MPAAAVIPAPIAYTKVVAVKKLVVEFLDAKDGRHLTVSAPIIRVHPREERVVSLVSPLGNLVIYCEQNRVFKAGLGHEYISME